MLVIIPLQGIAATYRPACHASAPVQQTKEHTSSHMHQDVQEDQVTGSHEHHVLHTRVAADADKHAFAKPDQCNACSPCCASALVSQVAELAMPDLVRPHEFFLPETRHASPPLAGLDRPPRYWAA
jgi:hypothetical protein